MIFHVLVAMLAGWLQRHQQQVITYLHEENRVLKAQLGGRRLRLTDTERGRLAALAYPLGRKRLKEVATLATPDTLLRWYKRLMALITVPATLYSLVYPTARRGGLRGAGGISTDAKIAANIDRGF